MSTARNETVSKGTTTTTTTSSAVNGNSDDLVVMNDRDRDLDRASRIEQATSHAVDLIRAFSERDPHDEGDAQNPWKNPQAMLEELDRARDLVVAAWQQQEEQEEDNRDGGTSGENIAAKSKSSNIETGETSDFRAAYMDMITNAFADVLEDMRNNNSQGDELDLDVLVDCLQSGIDLMSMEEVELFMGNDDEETDNEDSGEHGQGSRKTPQEKRRVDLGLHVC